MIKVLIADDQALVRGGIRMILDAQDDIEVIGEAGDGDEAVAQARRLRPDVIVMDVRMPKLDGIAATRRLVAEPGAQWRVLMLTTFDLDEYVFEALRAGASGFLLKTAPPRQLASAVRDAAAGDVLLAPAITRRLIEEFVQRRPPVTGVPDELDLLTQRELEVLRLLARGLTNAEIAEQIYVSESTAKTHVGRILTKLSLRDRTQAVVLAYESGLITPGQAAEEAPSS